MCYAEPETHCDEIHYNKLPAMQNNVLWLMQINAEEWEHETTPGA